MVRYRKPDRRQTNKRGFTRNRDAELFLASVEVSKARGEFIEASAGRVTVGELGAAWLMHQTHLKPSSWRPLEIAWRLYVEPRWGRYSVGDERHGEVQAWISGLSTELVNAKPRSATTVIRVHGVLAAILDAAVKDRRINTNPARDVNLPRKRAKKHLYLTHTQVERLAVEASKHGTLARFLSYTGLRWGEAVGLRVSDADLERRRITVHENAVRVGDAILLGSPLVGSPKSHRVRSVPLPASVATERLDVVMARR
jgi:integrase